MTQTAILLLRDGTVFSGYCCAGTASAVGEIVFNTSVTGYQEILTDPSYAWQSIIFTNPHIGNTGVNEQDAESHAIHARAAIVRSPSPVASNYRSKKSFLSWMKEHNKPVLAGLDTRALTHHIRKHGSQDGAIVACTRSLEKSKKQAIELLDAFPGIQNTDLAKEVSTPKQYNWNQSTWQWASGYTQQTASDTHIVVYDFGVKHTILRLLAKRRCRVTVVPAMTSAQDVLSLKPDGILLSNGPGDPQPCDYAIAAIKTLLHKRIPILGICLGFQLLALALGGRTKKMKFGHHGANHPVQDRRNGTVYITSQNHGFEVDPSSLDETVDITHVSLFDKSLQGLRSRTYPAIGFQGHPEASPGPQDIQPIFDEFIEMVSHAKKNRL